MNIFSNSHKPVVIFLVLLFGVSMCETAAAQVQQAHPRIWLTPAKKAQLADRMARNTPGWSNLIQWCENNINQPSSYFASNPGYAMNLLTLTNFGLAYQVTGDERYADKALSVVIDIMNDPPYGDLVYWQDYWLWYPVRYSGPGMAITLDWCWDAATQAQRDRIISGLDELCNGMMNSDDTFSWHDPSNNYYYGEMWALLSSAYAMYGHNPNAATYLDYAKNTMLEQAVRYCNGEQIIWSMWDNNIGRSHGGIWNEGTAYGFVNTDMLCSAILAVRSAEDPNAYSDFDWPEDAIRALNYMTYPDGTHMLAEADGAGLNTINDKTRCPMLMTMEVSRDITDSRIRNIGQTWVNAYTSPVTADYKLFHELLWYDDSLAEADRSYLPDYHFADGLQWLMWRTGWEQGDAWIGFRAGILNTDHGHNGLGHFIIYKDGFLVADKSYQVRQQELPSDLDHNVVYIPPTQDKRLYWGQSVIEHLESTPDYMYFAGDLSGPYLAQPDYRGNTVAHKEREFLLLKRELAVVIMDRAASFETSREKTFQIYFPDPPSGSGRDFRVSNGSNDLVIHTAYPTNAVGQTDNYGCPRLRVTTSQTSAGKTFLHVTKVTSPGGAFPVADVTSSTSEVVGTAFSSGYDNHDFLVAFSNEPEGDVPGASTFTLTFNHFNQTLRAYVLNTSPNTQYYVEGLSASNQADVTVSRAQFDGGTPVASNTEGLLYFELILGEDPSPVQTPSGIGIR